MTWHIVGEAGEPSFINGWQNFKSEKQDMGIDHRPCGFRLDDIGCVHIVGMVMGGYVGNMAPVFELLEGFRPPYTIHLPCVSDLVFGYIHINPKGKVAPHVGGSVWVSLDELIFSVI